MTESISKASETAQIASGAIQTHQPIAQGMLERAHKHITKQRQ
jgi:hypothetical protein